MKYFLKKKTNFHVPLGPFYCAILKKTLRADSKL